MTGRTRLSALLLALVLVLPLCGCGRYYEGDYTYITKHEEATELVASDTPYYVVHTYLGLNNALKTLISSAAETGTVRAVDYTGSVADDVARVCQNITREYPLGAYAVEYISTTVTRILSYDEVKFRITYRRTPEEISGIRIAINLGDMYTMMENAVAAGRSSIAVQISSLNVSERTLSASMEGHYRRHPERLISNPRLSIEFYPTEEAVSKIVRINFNYQETRDESAARLIILTDRADSITSGFRELPKEEAALRCCLAVSESIHSISGRNTAYDALIDGNAGSEGCAMAFQLLCNSCGLDCQVVEGRTGGTTRFWNIIQLDQQYYHVDCFACVGATIKDGFLLNDDDLRLRYWWDVDKFPACRGTLDGEAVAETYLEPESSEEAGPAQE